MNGVEITGYSMENTEVQLLPHTIPKSQPEMVIEINVKAKITKFLGEKLL